MEQHRLTVEGIIALSDGRIIPLQGNNVIHIVLAEAIQKQCLIQRIFAFFGFVS
jgi:hypothetical protein